MPLMRCQMDGKSGWKWGENGTCYTHSGDAASMMAAKKKAIKQAVAVRMSQKRSGKPMEPITEKK